MYPFYCVNTSYLVDKCIGPAKRPELGSDWDMHAVEQRETWAMPKEVSAALMDLKNYMAFHQNVSVNMGSTAFS